MFKLEQLKKSSFFLCKDHHAYLKGRYDEIIESQTKSIYFLWSVAFPNPLRLRKAVIICNPTAFTWNPSLSRYPQLRELGFYKFDMIGPNMVNELMTRAQGVELIRIEYCQAEFYIFPIDVLQIVEGRQKPLTLNFYKNPWTDDHDIDVIPTILGQHQLLKLTETEPLPIKDNYVLHIKFDDVNANNNATNDGDINSVN